jgi:hypothetical protein
MVIECNEIFSGVQPVIVREIVTVPKFFVNVTLYFTVVL